VRWRYLQANGFFVVNGGCAANASVAVARLGGRALLAATMGIEEFPRLDGKV
jgi:sugar/nucleoside kinase (ribokinase family)